MADREGALVALEALLAAIPSVSKVERQFVPIDGVAATNFPCILIEDDGLEEIRWKTGGLADVDFTVNLVMYVKDNNNVSTAINTLDRAVKAAIGADLTLGGAAACVVIEPHTERSGSVNKPYGFVVRPVRIMYEGQLANGL